LNDRGPGLDILVVSQFFTPEMGAPAARFHDFGRLLVERGHRVQVLTGFPNSPSGVIPADYRGRLRQRESIDGVEVLRGWLYASPRASRVTKALGFGSYVASASLWALLGRIRADVVIATSPPPTVALPGLLAARRLGVPLLFDVRDIWPEAIVASNRLRSGALIRLLEAVERLTYRSAAAVTVVTEGKRERLLEKGVPADRLHVLPNGVDLGRFEAVRPDRALLREHGVDPSCFVVLYAGIFNPPQGLDVLLDAASRLRGDVTPRVQFVLVGNGSERARLEGRRREEGLEDHVVFLPEQARERIPGLLAAADAVAITLRPRRDQHTVPSKIYEAMASGRPLVISADGAPARIAAESGAALASAAGDPDGLADAVRRLIAEPGLRTRLASRGPLFAARFDRRELVGRLEALLLGLARPLDSAGSAPGDG
jgi:colanic acid biosynthesis glycosyl transferase WcaI